MEESETQPGSQKEDSQINRDIEQHAQQLCINTESHVRHQRSPVTKSEACRSMRTLSFLLAFSLVSGSDLNDCRCAWLGLDKAQRLAIYQGQPPEQPSNGATVPAAWACFQNRIYQEGWSYLEVETNPSVEDGIQAYAAGALEAHLTRQLMDNHWLNMFGGYCRGNSLYCSRLRQFFDANIGFSQGMQDLHRETDSYWRM
ncbi:putative phospholipase B-like 2, partial [Dermacentor silvarum]|uniref:putative phospholipase B-like 2 n=1 Tax=Dermacentor silvarum TaxID=543639 RepID=UPI001898A187